MTRAWKNCAIDDPAAIEALVAVFKNRPSSLCEVLRVIGQMPGQEATDALLQQAMLSKNDDVRLTACEQLKPRSVYGYVPKLMAALSTPLRTKFEVLNDGQGVHFRETVERQGQNATVGKSVDTEVTLLTPNPNLANIIGQAYTESILDNQATATAIAKLNRKLIEFNESIYRVLENTVGKMAARDPEAWWDWWHKRNVLGLDKKPAYCRQLLQPGRSSLRAVRSYRHPKLRGRVESSHSAPPAATSAGSQLLCPRNDGLDVRRADAD